MMRSHLSQKVRSLGAFKGVVEVLLQAKFTGNVDLLGIHLYLVGRG
jgi:hypothetical protein